MLYHPHHHLSRLYRHKKYKFQIPHNQGYGGYDKARISYLTEKYGHDMTNDIEKSHDVGDGGNDILRKGSFFFFFLSIQTKYK